jgi:hypothetical protein
LRGDQPLSFHLLRFDLFPSCYAVMTKYHNALLRSMCRQVMKDKLDKDAQDGLNLNQLNRERRS